MTHADADAVTWGLFVLLEKTANLPDSEVDAFFEAAEGRDRHGTDGLLSGWAIVAALLRKRLIEYAETLGCECGSAKWLNSEQLRLADR